MTSACLLTFITDDKLSWSTSILCSSRDFPFLLFSASQKNWAILWNKTSAVCLFSQVVILQQERPDGATQL